MSATLARPTLRPSAATYITTEQLVGWLPHVLGVAAALALFVAAVWADFLNAMVFKVPREACLAAGVGLSLAACAARTWRADEWEHYALPTLLLTAPVLVAHVFILIGLGASLASTAHIYAPLVAVALCVSSLTSIRRLLFATMAVTLAMQFYEIAAGHFVYDFLVEEEGIRLDAKAFGAGFGLFRAKGIFAGPTLTASAAIICVLIHGRSAVITTVCMLVCILSGSRSTLLFLIGLVATQFVIGKLRDRMTMAAAIVVMAITISLAVFFDVLSSVTTDRLFSMFDDKDTSNQARFYYWAAALDLYLNDYSLAATLFGDPRATYRYLGNSAENEFLQVLLDAGILGFTYYAIFFMIATFRSRFDRYELGKILSFLVVSFVVTTASQAGLCIMTWTYVWHIVLARRRT